jgi:hypothetical protein
MVRCKVNELGLWGKKVVSCVCLWVASPSGYTEGGRIHGGVKCSKRGGVPDTGPAVILSSSPLLVWCEGINGWLYSKVKYGMVVGWRGEGVVYHSFFERLFLLPGLGLLLAAPPTGYFEITHGGLHLPALSGPGLSTRTNGTTSTAVPMTHQGIPPSPPLLWRREGRVGRV